MIPCSVWATPHNKEEFPTVKIIPVVLLPNKSPAFSADSRDTQFLLRRCPHAEATGYCPGGVCSGRPERVQFCHSRPRCPTGGRSRPLYHSADSSHTSDYSHSPSAINRAAHCGPGSFSIWLGHSVKELSLRSQYRKRGSSVDGKLDARSRNKHYHVLSLEELVFDDGLLREEAISDPRGPIRPTEEEACINILFANLRDGSSAEENQGLTLRLMGIPWQKVGEILGEGAKEISKMRKRIATTTCMVWGLPVAEQVSLTSLRIGDILKMMKLLATDGTCPNRQHLRHPPQYHLSRPRWLSQVRRLVNRAAFVICSGSDSLPPGR